jgi:hypothetical protein
MKMGAANFLKWQNELLSIASTAECFGLAKRHFTMLKAEVPSLLFATSKVNSAAFLIQNINQFYFNKIYKLFMPMSSK